MYISRRAILGTSALLPAAALVGCGIVTTTKVNGVTTITVNVAQINAWAQAFGNGAAMVAGLPGIVGTPAGAAIAAISALVKVDAAAFNTAAAGSLTLTFNATSVPASIQSIVTDGQTLLNATKAAIPQVPAAAATLANTYLNAIATLVSLAEAAITTKVGTPHTPMTEGAALAVLRVH